jgi:hypothetical protein
MPPEFCSKPGVAEKFDAALTEEAAEPIASFTADT